MSQNMRYYLKVPANFIPIRILPAKVGRPMLNFGRPIVKCTPYLDNGLWLHGSSIQQALVTQQPAAAAMQQRAAPIELSRNTEYHGRGSGDPPAATRGRTTG